MLARVSTWRWSGDRGMLRSYDGSLPEANAAARAAQLEIAARAFDEVEDLVPGARTLLVILGAGREPSTRLLEMIEAQPREAAATVGSQHEVPTRYSGDDLAELSQILQMTRERIIRLHSSVEYTVGFIGFSPGFPYLIGLPPRLVTARLATPRKKVPAGSVAIAGEYTGIYPTASPGGWRLIGSTDFSLFDASKDPPSTLIPGDRVRFVPS